MPKAARLGDIASGHGCFPPSPITSGSGDVFINGIPAARVGDSAAPHGCKDCPPHCRNIAAGSATVFINGRPAARIGDALSCGGFVSTGSGNVHIGSMMGSSSLASSPEPSSKLSVTSSEEPPPASDGQSSTTQSTKVSAKIPDAKEKTVPVDKEVKAKDQRPVEQEQNKARVSATSNVEELPFAAGFVWNNQLTTLDHLYKDYYGSFNSKTYLYFKRVNSHLQSEKVLPGEIVIFANPPISDTDREALKGLQQQAKLASKGIQQLSPGEADTVKRNFSLLESVNSDVLANSSVGIGVPSAMVGARLSDIQRVLEKLNQNYLSNTIWENGKARFGNGFYIQRSALFRELDHSLNRLTMLTLNIPVSSKVKHTLKLSSKSILHNWDSIQANGKVPQLGQRINTVARVAKGARYAGYLGIALDVGVSATEINKACFGPEADQCEKVSYIEVGRAAGSIGGGTLGASIGATAASAATSFVIALGVTVSLPVIAIIAVTGAGVGAFYGSSHGGKGGAFAGDKLYRYFGESRD